MDRYQKNYKIIEERFPDVISKLKAAQNYLQSGMLLTAIIKCMQLPDYRMENVSGSFYRS